MGILDVLKDRKNKLVTEEKPSDYKVRKNILSKSYNCELLYYGNITKTVEIDGKKISYTHSECFVADNRYPLSINRFVRLTGDNLTGRPITVDGRELWDTDTNPQVSLYIEENGVRYHINANTRVNRTWLNKRKMTGSEIEIETNRRNEVEINLKLKRIKDKNETNSLCN